MPFPNGVIHSLKKSLYFVKQKFGNQPIIGAEVGVAEAQNALDILLAMPNVKLLYLVDPYVKYPEWKMDGKPYHSRSGRTIYHFDK